MIQPKYYYGCAYVTSANKMPEEAHYAIVEDRSILSVDYDGKSYSDTTIKYTAFENETALKDYLLKLDKYASYRVIRVNPVEVSFHASVSIKV